MENLPKIGDILVLRESRREIIIRNILSFGGQTWYVNSTNNKWMWSYIDESDPNRFFLFDYKKMLSDIIYPDELRDEKLNSLL